MYGGRGEIDKSSKILFLDDWIVSGDQVKERIAGFEVDNDPEDHEASVWLWRLVEIILITA